MPYITYLPHNKITRAPTSLNQILQATQRTMVVLQRRPVTVLIENTEVSDSVMAAMNSLTLQVKHLNDRYRENKASHFTIFQIPKATGGMRTIKAPSDELKTEYTQVLHTLQHVLKLKAHDSAYAYIPARSIRNAIEQHQRNESNWFLKLDIKHFFDSCSKEVITTQLSKIFPLNHAPALVAELAEFATLDDELPQGTPLSPFLTNLLMIPFDYDLSQLAKTWNFVYTRYADDILISKKEAFKFTDITEKIESYFTSQHYPFELKKEKTRYGNRSGNNWNLGLMLNKDNNITLGHEFKHRIKTILFQTHEGQIQDHDPQIIGLFAYLKSIEPIYYVHLDRFCIRKYGLSVQQLINP